MTDASGILKEKCAQQLFALAGETSPLDFKSRKIGIPTSLLFKMQKLSNRQIMLLAQSHSQSFLRVEGERSIYYIKTITTAGTSPRFLYLKASFKEKY